MSTNRPIRNKSTLKSSILSASNFLLPTDFTKYLKLEDPQENEVLIYKNSNWINSDISVIAVSPVNLTEPPENFDLLVYNSEGNGGNGEWFPNNPFGVSKFYNSPDVNNTGIVSSNVSPGVYNLTWPKSVFNNGYTMHITTEMRNIFGSPTIITSGFRVLNSSAFQIYIINDAEFENNFFTFSVIKFGKLAAHGTVDADGTLLSLTYNDGVL